MQVSLPLVAHDQCKKWYHNLLTENMVCAGYQEGGKGSCFGDSGGPLVCKNATSGLWQQVGITNWGSRPCAVPNRPSVYARVTRYLEWIAEKTGGNVLFIMCLKHGGYPAYFKINVKECPYNKYNLLYVDNVDCRLCQFSRFKGLSG
jgi:hypothetical protein